MEDEISLAPAAEWELRAIPAYGAIALTMLYLVSPMESPEQAHRSPNFLMHPAQLRELADALLSAAQKAESAGTSPIGGPKH